MNKKALVVVGLGVLGTIMVIGITQYLPITNNGYTTCPHSEPLTNQVTSETSSLAPDSITSDVSSSQELSTALAGNKPFVIKFYANWCGACSYVNSYYSELAQEIPNVDFYSVNIDNQDLMLEIDKMKIAKEDITYLPTFVMINPGKTHTQTTGAKKKEAMITDIKKAFEL